MEKLSFSTTDENKRFIKIDSDNYFVDFCVINENKNPEDVLVAWDETGGRASDGYDTPIIPKNQLIPPDVIYELPPTLTEFCTNINDFMWTGSSWSYNPKNR